MMRMNSSIAQPPFQPAAQQGHRQQDDEVEHHQQEKVLGRLVVQADEVFCREHQIHQADGAEHAGLLEQEDDIGHKGRHTDGDRLRQHHIAHGLQSAHAKAQSTFCLDGFDGFQPAAEGLGHVAAAQKGKACNAAELGVGLDADLGQAVIQKEQLDQQRRVPAELDISAHDTAQHRHFFVLEHGADKAHKDGPEDTGHTQTQGEPGRFFILRQILRHHIPVHVCSPPFLLILRMFVSVGRMIYPFPQNVNRFIGFLLHKFRSN